MRYENMGHVISFDLQDGYLIRCNYNFDKEKNMYRVTLFLTRNDLDYIEKIDTYWLDAAKTTIKHLITELIEKKCKEGFFDYYIERIIYTLKCFDKGNDIFECVRLYEEK